MNRVSTGLGGTCTSLESMVKTMQNEPPSCADCCQWMHNFANIPRHGTTPYTVEVRIDAIQAIANFMFALRTRWSSRKCSMWSILVCFYRY